MNFFFFKSRGTDRNNPKISEVIDRKEKQGDAMSMNENFKEYGCK